jgi:hypothetical protein
VYRNAARRGGHITGPHRPSGVAVHWHPVWQARSGGPGRYLPETRTPLRRS